MRRIFLASVLICGVSLLALFLLILESMGWKKAGRPTVRHLRMRTEDDMRTLASSSDFYRRENESFPPVDRTGEYRFPIETLLAREGNGPYILGRDISEDRFKREQRYILKHWLEVYWYIPLIVAVSLAAMAVYARMGDPVSWKMWRLALTFLITPGLVTITVLCYLDSENLPRNIVRKEWRGGYLGYHYYTDGRNGCVLQSVGPNHVRDLKELEQVLFSPEFEDSLPPIVQQHMYDPTNGTDSAGDLFEYRAEVF